MTYLQRKKLAFMSVVNRVKGFVRTVMGIPPLTLPDCVDEDSLIDYTIEGNSVQNGTPTPENPVEVESVGVKTKNLFNETTDIVRKYDGDSIVNEYECYKIYDYSANCGYDTDGSGAYGRAIFEIAVDLKANKTYTISAKFLRGYNANGSTSNDAFQARIACKYSDGTYMTSSNESFFAYGTAHSTTTPKQGAWAITPTKDITRIQIQYYLANSYCWMLKNSLQIEESSSRTVYEPYGYKIPVVCSGKNLFKIRTPDKTGQSAYLGYGVTSYKMNDDGSYTIYEYGAIGFNFNNLVAGEKYTVSCKFASTATMASGQYCFIGQNMYSGATGVKKARAYDVPNYIGKRLKLTFTADTTNLIAFAVGDCSDTTHVIITDIQLEKGDTRTDYEPYVEPVTTNIYLDEPLRKVGKYVDTIDFENQKVIRNTRVLNSSNALSKYIHNSTWCSWFFTGFQKKEMTASLSNVCMYIAFDADFTSSASLMSMGQAANTTNGTYALLIRIKNDALGVAQSDTDAVKLAAVKRYLEDCGAYFVTLITTPIEEQITLPKLPAIKGTTVYTIGTTTQPSNMSATYYATSKE